MHLCTCRCTHWIPNNSRHWFYTTYTVSFTYLCCDSTWWQIFVHWLILNIWTLHLKYPDGTPRQCVYSFPVRAHSSLFAYLNHPRKSLAIVIARADVKSFSLCGLFAFFFLRVFFIVISHCPCPAQLAHHKVCASQPHKLYLQLPLLVYTVHVSTCFIIHLLCFLCSSIGVFAAQSVPTIQEKEVGRASALRHWVVYAASHWQLHLG